MEINNCPFSFRAFVQAEGGKGGGVKGHCNYHQRTKRGEKRRVRKVNRRGKSPV